VRVAPQRRLAWVAKLVLGTVLLTPVACGLGAPREPAQESQKPRARTKGPESRLGALPMAQVPSGTFGPHLAMTGAGPFVAWAEPAPDGAIWRTMAPGTKTRLRLGPVLPKTSGMLSFFKLDRARDGAVLAQVTRRDRIDAVSVTLLRASGATAPQEVSAEEGEVLWVASVPQGPRVHVLWARRRGAGAEISAASLDALGKVDSRESIRQGAIGWQVAEGPAGTWLATLEGTGQKATLVLTKLDGVGPRGQSFEIAKDLKGADQLDLWVGDATVAVSLRDEDQGTTRLRVAEVDQAGAIVAPLRAVTALRGEQSLLKLLSLRGSKRPWLAWEEPALDGPSWRRVLLARLEKDGVRAPEAWLDVHDTGSLLPGLAASDTNVVALTREAACSEGQPDCIGTPSGLSLLALGVEGPSAGRVASVPGLPAELPRGSLCWDLDCLADACGVLCAETDTPTSVHFAAFEPGGVVQRAGVEPGKGRPEAALRDLSAGPRVVRVEPVAPVAALADVALGRGDTQTLLAWVTDFDPSVDPKPLDRPAPDGRREPYQAEVRIAALAGSSAAASGAQAPAGPGRQPQGTVISYRARSLGGVSLSGERAGRRVLGWAALDQGRAHVFATLVDAQGKKIKQRLLSRKSGEVTDVQVVTTSSGFLLFWVDDRSGRGQVYAQAVDGELNSVGPERTLTPDTKDPIGLFALVRGEQVVLTFGDSQVDGRGSVFAMSVLARNLDTVVAPRALTAGDGHAHSPVLYTGPKGDLSVMYVEGAVGDVRETTELRTLPLDVGLRAASPAVVVLPAVDIRTFGLDCEAAGCQVVAVSADVQRAELWGAASPDGTLWRSQFLLGLEGDTELIPPPAVLKDEAFVAMPSGDDGFVIDRLVIDFALDAASR